MNTHTITRTLNGFTGTSEYHKHLFPGKSPILLTEGCDYIRKELKAYWLFDAILSYQEDSRLKGINFQIWELQQLKSDLNWLLTCKEDAGKKSIISQVIKFSDFPLPYIKIWVIDKVALLPSEY